MVVKDQERSNYAGPQSSKNIGEIKKPRKKNLWRILMGREAGSRLETLPSDDMLTVQGRALRTGLAARCTSSRGARASISSKPEARRSARWKLRESYFLCTFHPLPFAP